MEKRKEKISTHKVCRFCLSESEPLENLYERNQTSKDAVNLHLKILTCVSVEVFPSDKMPCYICNRCNSLMNLFYNYKHIVRQADENILHYIQSGTPLEPINWSSALLKASKISKEVVMKTVVEGGATVQVSSQDASDSEEEDDGNIYSVKIGDGMDGEEKTACIKVVSAKTPDSMELSEPSQGFSSVTKLARHVRGHAGVRAYPCKYCDKSFTKSHHYTRHLRVRHRNETRSSRDEQYRCEQCDITFNTQDELIYHSAIHATQSLTCPLCQEKFNDVDAVTTHIKSHVTGDEFMCDFCELVFTSREKLDSHMMAAHDEEMQQDVQDESEGMDAEDEDEDNSINVKEVDENNMVIEIKKPDEFMIKGTNESRNEKVENTNSEESEAEATPNDVIIPTTTPTVIKKPPITILSEQTIYKPAETVTSDQLETAKESPKPQTKKNNTQLLDMVWCEDEPKPKAVQQTEAAPAKKVKPSAKVESSGVGDKSLRLLEKELQDLKRTTNSSKSSGKSTDGNHKSRRPLHSSTPKLKSGEEKKIKSVIPKKVPTKENKEPKEVKEKEPKTNGNDKEDKDRREEKESKSLLKNGGNSSDKSTDEGIRRSTRPSKIKNYAKMVRDKPQPESDEDTEDDGDEEYKEVESRSRGRRSSSKHSPKPTSTVTSATPVRKRGRPRKDAGTPVPAKVKKESEESDEEAKDIANSSKLKYLLERNKLQPMPSTSAEVKSPPMLVYPSGQTLKKIPVKALPPGVKALPLPANARLTGDLCEMQIGKKVVKVQKIVMTRAEVEAMAKKGLVEMKDGTMVLKQGIKLPTSDPANIKSTLVGETSDASKEPSPKPTPKKEIPKATPTRCDLEES